MRLLAATCAAALFATLAGAQGTPEDVRVGHWIEVRGDLVGEEFAAARADLDEPEKYQRLVGTIRRNPRRDGWFVLVGQPVRVRDDVEWEGGLSLTRLDGRRVGLEGRWRGPARLSARKIQPWGEGRERLQGRVDELWRDGEDVMIRVMGRTVRLPAGIEVRHEVPLEELELAEPTEITAPETAFPELPDDDDLFGEGIRLTDSLVLESQITLRSIYEGEFDLDETDQGNRFENVPSARTRLVWDDGGPLHGLAEVNYRYRWRDDEEDGTTTDEDGNLGEAWLAWRDPFGLGGWEWVVGRQDFDDEREWLYDENLDAVRALWRGEGLALDLGVSTTLADGDRRERDSLNWTAYVSNGDDERHLALWSVLRDVDTSGAREHNLHLGARALGEWVEDTEVWLDVAHLTGSRTGTDVSAWGYDAGITWYPDVLEPLYVTASYALGSGDANPGSEDGTFRQTGFQDNNGRYGGVTSFRYYGELVDPELSNLGILTLGVGARLTHDVSLDVVFHKYVQDQAQAFIADSELRETPDGLDPDLGWELDAIVGVREGSLWSFEGVAAWFEPGDAFPGADPALLGKLQLRLRL